MVTARNTPKLQGGHSWNCAKCSAKLQQWWRVKQREEVQNSENKAATSAGWRLGWRHRQKCYLLQLLHTLLVIFIHRFLSI